jgi:hypothetical protein
VCNLHYNFILPCKDAATKPSNNINQFLLDLRRVHSKISAVMDLTDFTFRTSILLSTIYCTFDMIYGIFYPFSILLGKDESIPEFSSKIFLIIVINISYVLGVIIVYIWFSWQCEEAVDVVSFYVELIVR